MLKGVGIEVVEQGVELLTDTVFLLAEFLHDDLTRVDFGDLGLLFGSQVIDILGFYRLLGFLGLHALQGCFDFRFLGVRVTGFRPSAT